MNSRLSITEGGQRPMIVVILDVINRKIDDPGAGECHFENYLAQDFESHLAPHGTDAYVPGPVRFRVRKSRRRSRGRPDPGHVAGVGV